MNDDQLNGIGIWRPMDRRRFLLGAAATIAGTSILAACGSGSSTSGGETAATGGETAAATTSAAPAAGGTLIYEVNTPASGFDPAKWWNDLSWNGSLAVFNRLLTVQADGSMTPELLAEPPVINAEGTLYTFKLRSGVKFQHGRELTAEDVKYTLERLVTPATASEGASLYTSMTIPGMQDILDEKGNELTGIKIVDPLSFTIELEQPDSVFLYTLGLPFAGIVPQDVIADVGEEAFNFAPVGTGPYTMQDVDPSKSLVLERFADHWNPDVGFLDRIEWAIGIEPDLSLLRIQDGQADMMAASVPAESYQQLAGDTALKAQLFVESVNNCYYFTQSLDHPALKDLRVRQAVAHAIDKERFVKTLRGLGEAANGGLFSPMSPYYQDGLGYAYDPEKAKQLLADAGFADGFDVTFWSADFTPYKEMVESVQQDLKAVGINVDAKVLIREQWLAEVVKNPAGLTNNQWDLPYPHGSYVMDGAFTEAAIEAGCCNFSNFRSGEFDQLAKDGHLTSDLAKQVELYKQMDKIAIQDEALWVPMTYPKQASLVSERVQGYSIPGTPSPGTAFFATYSVSAA